MDKKIKNLIVIPCRMESKRFPGKPLAKVAGKFLLEQTYLSALQSKLADEVIIATEDEFIKINCDNLKIPCYLIKEKNMDFWCGTKRSAYVAQTQYPHLENCISLQVDEPLIKGEDLDTLFIKCSEDPWKIHSLDQSIDEIKDLTVNDVLICTIGSYSSFYRHSYWVLEKTSILRKYYTKHIGVYAFRHTLCSSLAGLCATVLSNQEQLEQLAFTWPVKTYSTNKNNTYISINVPEDILILEEYYAKQT